MRRRTGSPHSRRFFPLLSRDCTLPDHCRPDRIAVAQLLRSLECVVLVLGREFESFERPYSHGSEHDGPLELILSGFGKAPSTASYTTCNAFVVERRRLRGTSPVHSAMLGVQLAEGALRDVNLCSGALDLVDETCALALSHRKFKLLALGVHGGGFMTVGLRVVGLS